MSQYINQYKLPQLSTLEVNPLTVTFADMPSTGNTLTSVKRFNMSNSVDTGLDISSVATISGNVVNLTNIWKASGDPTAVGNYRIQIVVTNPTPSTTTIECNIICTVI